MFLINDFSILKIVCCKEGKNIFKYRIFIEVIIVILFVYWYMDISII